MVTASPTRIIIRHLSGSKSNQIEQFDLTDLKEVTVGREPSSNVAYDLQRDDLVSRKHAVIRIRDEKELYFRIADLNSSNGTLLNGERITGEVELLPADVVELGPGGPKFAFDVQPRPVNLPTRTRQMGVADVDATRVVAEATAAATRESAAVPATAERSTPAKLAVGQATVMRMLTTERRKTSRVWLGALAAVLVLAALGGGGLYWHNQTATKQLQQQLAQQEQRLTEESHRAASALAAQMGVTAQDIRRLGDATVQIKNRWWLYDRITGRQVYQRMVRLKNETLPCFVKLEDGTIVRWLTLDEEGGVNIPIGGDHSGSGFVVGEQGFLLTNKHVAASWTSEYDDSSDGSLRGAVYNVDGKSGRQPLIGNHPELLHWVPEGGAYVFQPGRPIRISSDTREFLGRNEMLTVQFPGTRMEINATLLRTSIDADVAEIKIEATQGLSKLELADDGSVQISDKIFLLGYPAVSQKTIAVQQSSERGRLHNVAVDIPEPTVTQGIVSKLPVKKDRREGGDIRTFGTMGDTYQLDIFAGPGDSGGPVLNSAGKVIGLLSYGTRRAEHVSFAVPVTYVRELLQPQRAASP